MKIDSTHWWYGAKFGMFIHWGVYAQLGGVYKDQVVKGNSEWIQHRLNISKEEYSKTAQEFNPVMFNAEEWVQLAKDAGMKYIVITAKHHDGFAIFKSKDPYNIMDATPFKRDPIMELSKACQVANIKLCFYYSHVLDWHEDDAFDDEIPISKLALVKEKNEHFNTYLHKKALPQLTELLTQYGDIGALWFDMPGCIDKKYCEQIYNHVKTLQPECIVSGRIGHGLGDFITVGDNKIPILPCNKPWEMPGTINDTWGFKIGDRHWKSPHTLIRNLIKICSRGGNYLLNVGPDKNGCIPEKSVEILKFLGQYVHKNADSIYETLPMPLYPYDISDDGMFTYKKGKLFYHCFTNHEKFSLCCIANSIKKVYLLGTNDPLKFEVTYSEANLCHDMIIEQPFNGFEDHFPVFCIEFEGDVPVFEDIFI